MGKIDTARRAVIALLMVTASLMGGGHSFAAGAYADGPVGADCTDPPNLVPFADLRNCDLSGRQMEGVDLANADLTGANLDNASLFSSNLVAAKFDNATLRGTNMDDAYAPGGSFINADLRGANLYFAFFRGGNLTGVNISDTWIGSADFESAILQNAVFANSELGDVDMRNTDLRGADLSFTALSYVSLSGADLRNANLLGADRGNGTPLDSITWGNTTCPDGSNSDDDDGDNFTCEANFPGNQPPAVSVTAPADNTTIAKGATVTVSADAADSDGSVIWVEFHAAGGRINTDSIAPYSYAYTPPIAGDIVITAKAFDNDGSVTESQGVTLHVLPPANTPPTVAITAPANNATVRRSSGTTIQASASDADGVIIKVEFYAGSKLLNTDIFPPYSYFWKPASTGSQTLTAKAYDNAGAVTTSAPVTVRVR